MVRLKRERFLFEEDWTVDLVQVRCSAGVEKERATDAGELRLAA